MSTVFHIDVNSAYLSWEAVYRLSLGKTDVDLREIPSVVGGDEESRHGIVLAKSIHTKKYGIKTGMTLWEARNKCPGLVVVPANYGLYLMCHQAMMEILKNFSPAVQVYSIDEAFLDYTGLEGIHGSPLAAAHKIREKIKTELGFTVNIGVSSSKLLAKMATEFEKPDKVHTLYTSEVKEKMWPLPVEDLFMVGRATAPKLHRLNIFTIGQLANTPSELLKQHLHSFGLLLRDYAWGLEGSPVIQDARPPIKGIGNTTTAPFDIDNLKEAKMILLSLAEVVGMRLRQAGFGARLVSVYIRGTDLSGKSHQHKLAVITDSTTRIYEVASYLLCEVWDGKPLRGMGLRVSDLKPNDFFQMSLFEPANEKKRKLDAAIDLIRRKYGSRTIARSCFIGSGISPITGGMSEDFKMVSPIL